MPLRCRTFHSFTRACRVAVQCSYQSFYLPCILGLQQYSKDQRNHYEIFASQLGNTSFTD